MFFFYCLEHVTALSLRPALPIGLSPGGKPGTRNEFLGLGGEEDCESNKPPQTGCGSSFVGGGGVLGTKCDILSAEGQEQVGYPGRLTLYSLFSLRRISAVIISNLPSASTCKVNVPALSE